MLMPKRVKRRKQFRGSMAGKALRGNKITYGEYGLVSLDPCWIKSNQIEAARVAMTRYIKRGGKVWIKIFPGSVLFEIAGVPEEVAREAIRLAMHKLPCRCKIVSKADLEGGEASEN